MTDLTPNDLSQMSDEDFNALCPQGHHAPGAEPFSPTAQAVDDATADIEAEIEFTDLASGFNTYRNAVAAAALRAAVAATQSRQYEGCWICSASDILAIAAELDPITGASGEH